MDGPAFAVLGELRAAVDGLAQHIKHTPQGLGADGHTDGAAGGSARSYPAARPSAASSRMQRTVRPPMCLATSMTSFLPVHLNGQGLFDPGEVVAVKDDIDHRSNDL